MEVPTYNYNRISTEVVGQPKFSAEQFGARDAAMLGDISESIIKISTVAKEENARATAREAINKYRVKMAEGMNKDVFGLQMGDASRLVDDGKGGQVPQSMKNLQDLDSSAREDILGGIKDEESRNLALGFINEHYADFSVQTTKYVGDQARKFEESQTETQAGLDATDAFAAEDTAVRDAKLANARGAINHLLSGYPENVRTQKYNEILTKNADAYINSLPSDQARLKQLDSLRDVLPAEYVGKKQESLMEGAAREAKQIKAAALVAGGDSGEKITDPVEREEFEKAKDAKTAQDSVAEASHYKAGFESLLDAANTGDTASIAAWRPVAGAPKNVAEAGLALQRNLLAGAAGKGEAETDWNFYTDLRSMGMEEFKKQNPKDWIGRLGKAEYKEVFNDWLKARGGSMNAQEFDAVNSDANMLKAVTRNDNDRAVIAKAWQSKVVDFQKDNGRKPNPVEKQQMLDRLVLDVREQGAWMSKKAFKYYNERTGRVELPKNFNVENMPEKDRLENVQELTRFNLPTTQDNVRRLYKMKVMGEYDGSVPSEESQLIAESLLERGITATPDIIRAVHLQRLLK